MTSKNLLNETVGNSTPLNINSNTLIKKKTGLNWKVLTNRVSSNQIINESVPSNRPPAHNTSHYQSSDGNDLLISGSNANNFKSRPLKHWRKQRSNNPESYGNQNNIPKNTNNKSLLLNYDTPGGTNINKISSTSLNNCETECAVNKTIPNWKIAFRKSINNRPKNNNVGQFNSLNNNNLCKPSVPNNVNINGTPSNIYLEYTSISVCDPPTKALNKIRTSTLINKNVNKLNNQKYYQSYNSYLKQKNKTYERNLGVNQSSRTPLNELYTRTTPTVKGLNSTPYNAFKDNCCQNVVKNYNNIKYGINSNILTRKRWGPSDASLKILESKVNNINLAAKNANKDKNDSLIFPQQGNAISNATKYNGNYNAPYTIKSKYYSPRQCSTDLNLFRKNGKFTTDCLVSVLKDGRIVKEKIFIDRPYRQTNNLIKTPITPQLNISKLAKLLGTSKEQILQVL